MTLGGRGRPALALRWAVCLPLAALTARRLLFLAAALAAPRVVAGPDSRSEPPSVALLVPARREAARLPGLLACLDRLSYPRARMHTILVDDASDDGTWEMLESYAAGSARTTALREPAWSGKPAALNAGLRAAPPTDLVLVCDADQRPEPHALTALTALFADERVAAASGYIRPRGAARAVVARYASVESWVHQLVTCAGKDRLDLNPPVLGGFCAYRRSALDEIGHLRAGAAAEDAEVAAALTHAGWRTRFANTTVSSTEVPATLADYWRQHVRWGRGIAAGGRTRPAAEAGRRVRAPVRLEASIAATAYADRALLLVALVLAGVRLLPRALPASYLLAAAAEVLVASARAEGAHRAPGYLLTTVTLFPLDVAASLAAVLTRRDEAEGGWRSPRAA